MLMEQRQLNKKELNDFIFGNLSEDQKMLLAEMLPESLVKNQ